MLRVDADRQHHGGHRRQLRTQLLIQGRELRNHKGDEEGHHHHKHRHQQCGIDQRSRQLLAEAHRQALEGDVAAHHLLQVAALLTCQQGSGINLGKNLCASNASESNSPPRTRSRTFCNTERKKRLRCRLISNSNDWMMGRPAWIRVTNCWLKMTNWSCLILRRRGKPPSVENRPLALTE